MHDIGLGAAEDAGIAAYAQSTNMAVVTRDFDFADLRNYPARDYNGIVVVDLHPDATLSLIGAVVGGLLEQDDLLLMHSGRLFIVEAGRAWIRS